MYLKFIVVICMFTVKIQSEKCTTPNNEQGSCIPLHTCDTLLRASEDPTLEEFVEKSICKVRKFIPKVCCGPSSNFTELGKNKFDQVQNTSKKSLLPNKKFCGFQHSDDYFRAPNDTSIRITEFPWLARIKYHPRYEKTVVFRCLGSLINTKYVLTSGFCLDEPWGYIPDGVRLGEFHVNNETDCVKELSFEEECSSPIEDFGIEKLIIHVGRHQQFNDMGLIRLNKTVYYTDYIRPICLPLPETKFAKPGDVLFTSGWGFSEYYHQKVEYKKKVSTMLLTHDDCTIRYFNASTLVLNLTESHICVEQLRSSLDEECHDDGGGPLMFSNDQMQWHQEGIVSMYFKQPNCELGGPPNIYIRVVPYLDWIIENLEP